MKFIEQDFGLFTCSENSFNVEVINNNNYCFEEFYKNEWLEQIYKHIEVSS